MSKSKPPRAIAPKPVAVASAATAAPDAAPQPAPASAVAIEIETAPVLQAPEPAPAAPAESPVEAKAVEEVVLPDLIIDHDGKATIRMLCGISGPEISVGPRGPHRCSPLEASRLIRAEMAEQPAAWLSEQNRG